MKPLCINRLAFGYKRTLDHLRAWQFVLPRAVKEAVVYLGIRGQQHAGTRLFVFENIPQLKYHNPGVRFSVERHRGEESKISFALEDNSCQALDTTNLRQRDIRQKIMEHNFEQSLST